MRADLGGQNLDGFGLIHDEAVQVFFQLFRLQAEVNVPALAVRRRPLLVPVSSGSGLGMSCRGGVN